MAGTRNLTNITEKMPIQISVKLIQFAWVIFVSISMVLTLMSIPVLTERYLEPCKDGGTLHCLHGQLPPESFRLLDAQGIAITSLSPFPIIIVVISRFLEIGLGGILIRYGAKNGIALVWGWLIVTSSILMFDYHAVLPYEHPLNTFFSSGSLFSQAFFPIALLAFPDGKFRPRYLTWVCLLLSCAYLFSRLLIPDLTTPGHTGYTVGVGASFVANALTISIIVYRYRRVLTTSQRIQVRWIIYGCIIAFALHIGFGALYGWNPTLNIKYDPIYLIGLQIITALSFFIFNITFVIAIVRYQLFDIDLIINRTLVYSALTTIVIALYMVIVSGFGSILQTKSNLPLSLFATGVIAVAFQPLRQRIQQRVNRLMFGRRDDPLGVLDDLGKRLEATLTPEAVLKSITETVLTALKLPYVGIEYAGETSIVAGKVQEDTQKFPLIYHAQIIGYLVVSPRASDESLNAKDRLILESVARQASAAIHTLRLSHDLQISRQHIISTREEERRRLRRDLHDGLGPALATLALQAEVVRDTLYSKPEQSERFITEIINGTQAAIDDIRRVVYDLRPAAIDDLGLFSALREQGAQYSQRGLNVVVETPDELILLPAAVEVAIYRIVQEALTNVQRHAQAQLCRVRLDINGSVSLEIVDDGRGIPLTRRAGVGLNSMHERATELGGSCIIESQPGAGTRIAVSLPYEEIRLNGLD
jgi:signal transduction histidine kinase